MKKTTNVFKICTKKRLNKLLLDFAKYPLSSWLHSRFISVSIISKKMPLQFLMLPSVITALKVSDKGSPESIGALKGSEGLTGPVEDPEGLKYPEDCEDLGGPEELEDLEGLGGP